MSEKLHAWINPGTITTLVMALLAIGSFVGVSKYEAGAQERNLQDFKAEIREQLKDDRRATGDRFEKFERLLAEMSKGAEEVIRLQERNAQLGRDIERLRGDLADRIKAIADAQAMDAARNQSLRERLNQELRGKGPNP